MSEYQGEERRKNHECEYGRLIQEMHDAILGTFDKKGIKTVLMEHEEFIKNIKNKQWLYFTLVIGGAITICFTWLYDWIRR